VGPFGMLQHVKTQLPSGDVVPNTAAPDGLAPSELKVPQLNHATNAPAAPDGLAPSELKVRSYPRQRRSAEWRS